MDVAVFLSPATLAASAVVFLCGWAAITLRNSSDRLAEVPKLYYIREQVARKTAERDIIEQRLNELRAEIATADREKAELAVLCQQKELRALELADIEAKIASLADDRDKIEEVQTQLAAALDQFSQIGQDVVDAIWQTQLPLHPQSTKPLIPS
jgi:hypothetical protein